MRARNLFLVFSLLFVLAGCFTKQDAPVFSGDIVVDGTVEAFHEETHSIVLEQNLAGVDPEILLTDLSKIYSSNGCLMNNDIVIAAGSTVKILGFYSAPYLVVDTLWLLDVEVFGGDCSASSPNE